MAHFRELDVACGSRLTDLETCGHVRYALRFWDSFSAAVMGSPKNVKTPSVEQMTSDGAGSVGVGTYAFSPHQTQSLSVLIYLPAQWCEQSTIRPVVHWCPATDETGTVVWALEYTLAPTRARFGPTQTIRVATPVSGEALLHTESSLPDIAGEGLTCRTIMVGRLYRDAADPMDTYPATAYLLRLGGCGEIDSPGSRSPDVK